MGADAEQVRPARTNRVDQLGGRHGAVDPLNCFGDRPVMNTDGRPRIDTAPSEDRCRSRPAGRVEQALPLGERRRGDRVGVEEDVPVIEGGDQANVVRDAASVAEDVARMSPMPTVVKSSVCVMAELAEVPLTDSRPRR